MLNTLTDVDKELTLHVDKLFSLSIGCHTLVRPGVFTFNWINNKLLSTRILSHTRPFGAHWVLCRATEWLLEKCDHSIRVIGGAIDSNADSLEYPFGFWEKRRNWNTGWQDRRPIFGNER